MRALASEISRATTVLQLIWLKELPMVKMVKTMMLLRMMTMTMRMRMRMKDDDDDDDDEDDSFYANLCSLL